MPFVQMENISHFLRACQSPPLNLPDHDVFLTVDLYEQKDPAQVLQCLSAFSRAANAANPSAFPRRHRSSGNRGARQPAVDRPIDDRPASATRGIRNRKQQLFHVRSDASAGAFQDGRFEGSGRWSPTKSPTQQWLGRISCGTSVAGAGESMKARQRLRWNIAQYGYMGGASQGNLGISFGGRRQITSAGPHVPNVAEKERRRKGQEAEAERQRQQMEEEERRRKAEPKPRRSGHAWRRSVGGRRRRGSSGRRSGARRRRRRGAGRSRSGSGRSPNSSAGMRRKRPRRGCWTSGQQSRGKSDSRLRGQFLSQYQAEQEVQENDGYKSRVKKTGEGA